MTIQVKVKRENKWNKNINSHTFIIEDSKPKSRCSSYNESNTLSIQTSFNKLHVFDVGFRASRRFDNTILSDTLNSKEFILNQDLNIKWKEDISSSSGSNFEYNFKTYHNSPFISSVKA